MPTSTVVLAYSPAPSSAGLPPSVLNRYLHALRPLSVLLPVSAMQPLLSMPTHIRADHNVQQAHERHGAHCQVMDALAVSGAGQRSANVVTNATTSASAPSP